MVNIILTLLVLQTIAIILFVGLIKMPYYDLSLEDKHLCWDCVDGEDCGFRDPSDRPYDWARDDKFQTRYR